MNKEIETELELAGVGEVVLETVSEDVAAESIQQKEMTTDLAKEEKIGYRDVFSQKEFLKVVLAHVISRFGDSIDAIAFTWLIYQVTGSATWSAIIYAMNMLPSVIVQPFTGALVEGMNKKKLLIVTDLIRGLLVASLVILYATGQVTAPILVIFTLLTSSVEAFHLPASAAVTPMVLEEKYYEYGTGFSSTIGSIVEIVGMGAAGVIIGLFGINTAIAIDGISFFGSAFILCFLHLKETNMKKGKFQGKEYLETLKAGAAYVKNNPIIRNFILMAVLLNAAMAPFNAFETPLVQDILGQESELLSVIGIALMAGMGAGSFFFPMISKKASARTLVILSGMGEGIVFYLYTLGNYFKENTIAVYALTIGVSALFGFSVSVMTSVLHVQFMKLVDKDYMARATSIMNAGACAAVPIASLTCGALATIFSVKQLFVASTVIIVLIFIYIAARKVRFE